MSYRDTPEEQMKQTAHEIRFLVESLARESRAWRWVPHKYHESPVRGCPLCAMGDRLRDKRMTKELRR